MDVDAVVPEPPSIPFPCHVYLALMVVIGSSTAPAARYAVREIPVGLVPLIRFGVAGLCLLPLAGRRGGNLARLWREDGRRLLLTALLCVPINQALFLNGARLAPTSHVALIYAGVPLVVSLLAVAVGQEALRPERLLGVVASVLGVLSIGLEGLVRGGGGANSWWVAWGDLLLVGAVVSWGGYLTLSKPLVARHGALTVLAGTFLAGTILNLPVALASAPGWSRLGSVSMTAWGGLAYLTLVVTIFTLTFQNLALRRLDASQVATFGNAAPILTVLWGVWLFDEKPTPALVLGGVLTLGGIYWSMRPSRRAVASGGSGSSR